MSELATLFIFYCYICILIVHAQFKIFHEHIALKLNRKENAYVDFSSRIDFSHLKSNKNNVLRLDSKSNLFNNQNNKLPELFFKRPELVKFAH